MAGRGRGRGRGQMTFNVEAVGIGKGDALPPPTLQPSPLFPALERRAAPLPGGEEGEYMLALKQELRRAMKGLPYFVKPGAPRRDWRRLPRELRIRVRRPRRGRDTKRWKRGDLGGLGVLRGLQVPPAPPVSPQETDYVLSYFDNGESFGPDSDDNGDEAVY
uniref:Uncharacterized protein n=1 Tax=Geospiza parvula TaxID=87175 RepID=A0A8C3N4D0_GEOPR